MKNKIELKKFIENIQTLYGSNFKEYKLECKILYNKCIFKDNKIIQDYRKGNINCLNSAQAYIGFNDNKDFYPLLNIYPCNKSSSYGGNVGNGHFIYGKKFKIIKSRMLRLIYVETMKLILNKKTLICSGIYPNIDPSLSTIFKINKDGKEYETENLLNINAPFNVLGTYIKFNYKEYKENFSYEVSTNDILFFIKKRYPEIDKYVNNHFKEN